MQASEQETPTTRPHGGDVPGTSDVVIADNEPQRAHVFSDLIHAAAALIAGVLVIVFAVYLRGITAGVESDAHTAARALEWLLDVPASFLQQLIVVYAVVSVLIQLVVSREWLRSACSVGALMLGFGAVWGVSYLLSSQGSAILVNSLL